MLAVARGGGVGEQADTVGVMMAGQATGRVASGEEDGNGCTGGGDDSGGVGCGDVGDVGDGGGGDARGDGAMMVDLSSPGPGDEGQEKPDPYDGDWDNDKDLAAAAAAVDAAAAAAAAATPGSFGSRVAATAVEVVEVDADSGCSDEDGGAGGVPSSSSVPVQATPTLARGPGDRNKGDGATANWALKRTEGKLGKEGCIDISGPAAGLAVEGEEDGAEEDGQKGKREEEKQKLALKERERLMPTTRHFHAEVEVCTPLLPLAAVLSLLFAGVLLCPHRLIFWPHCCGCLIFGRPSVGTGNTRRAQRGNGAETGLVPDCQTSETVARSQVRSTIQQLFCSHGTISSHPSLL